MTQKKGSILTLFLITILVPLTVWPWGLDNVFQSPKLLVLYSGVGFLAILNSENIKKIPSIVIALIALNLFSLFYTQNYYYTKIAAMMNISVLLLYYFTSRFIQDEKHLIWMFYAIVATGVIIAIICYAQKLGYSVIYKTKFNIMTPIGTVGNSNHTGCYLLFPIFASLGLCFILKDKYRLIAIAALAVIFGAFLLTRARASWLAFGLTLPVALCLLTRSKKALIAGIMAVTVTVTIAWTMFPNSFLMWTETTTLNERSKYFEASYDLWMTSPLYGTGLWSYRNMVYESQAKLGERDPSYFADYQIPKPRRVHNDYLEILNDGGLLAALLLSLFLYGRLQHGWQIWNRERIKPKGQDTQRVLAATLISIVIAVMLSAFFFFPFRIVVALSLTAVILGMMEGLYCKGVLSAQS